MLYKGVFKRIFPFFLTFAAGLFIASFFVSVAAPKFNWRSNHRGSYKYREYKRLKMENRELRNERNKLQQQLEELRRTTTLQQLEYAVPPVPPVALDAPPAPRGYHRHGGR